MRLLWAARVLAVIALLGLTVVTTSADEGTVSARAKLSGFQESPPKLTNGTGTFTARVNGGMLSYTLTFSGLSSDAMQAHIHFAQPAVNGGIFLWLCGSPTFPGPTGTPPCPAAGGTVSGTASGPAILSLLTTQNLNAGDFNGAVRIIQSGNAYVNVHTANFPGGEIRGQVKTNND
jgi:hypothetical protein